MALAPFALTILFVTACVAIETPPDALTPLLPGSPTPSPAAGFAPQIPTPASPAPAPTVPPQATLPRLATVPAGTIPPAATAAPVATPTPNVPPECLIPRVGATPNPVSPRLVAPGNVPPPQRLQPLTSVAEAELQQRLMAALGDKAGSYAFVVKNLRTGQYAAHDPDRVFYAASVFKVFVMYEVFHQESAGLLRLDDRLAITPYYDQFGVGPRRTRLCQQLSVREALDAMMSLSDNAAAVLLQDLVGAENVNRALAALGLTTSRLSEDGSLPLTAADIALLMEAIGRGVALSQGASEQMAQLMAREAFDNGLVAGLPPGVGVAHKTGNWNNATHEAGIVFAPDGAYVFIVLSETEHERDLIKELSRLVYEYF